MAIRLTSRVDVEQVKLEKVLKNLEDLQRELIVNVKTAVESIIELEGLYEIRDHIDRLIEDWVDEDIELDDDFLDD